jgi:hypothetical protein
MQMRTKEGILLNSPSNPAPFPLPCPLALLPPPHSLPFHSTCIDFRTLSDGFRWKIFTPLNYLYYATKTDMLFMQSVTFLVKYKALKVESIFSKLFR